MTRVLASYINQYNCVFTFQGEAEPVSQLFSPEVFLPVVAMHAEILAGTVLGCPLGIEFLSDEKSLFGVLVNVAPLTGDELSIFRATFFIHAVHQIFGLSKEIEQIECAPVFEAYEHGLLHHVEQTGEIQWPIATAFPR